MSKKNYRNNSNNDRYQVEDDFEDFGYEVKNIRRQSKKKVTKFKREQDHYEDSYWSGTQNEHGVQNRVLLMSRQELNFERHSNQGHDCWWLLHYLVWTS